MPQQNYVPVNREWLPAFLGERMHFAYFQPPKTKNKNIYSPKKEFSECFRSLELPLFSTSASSIAPLPVTRVAAKSKSSKVFAADASIKSALLNPMNCSVEIMTCNASLYHINIDLKIKEIATLYTVYPSKIRPIKYKKKRDSHISVPCSCQNVSGTVGYFYDTTYKSQSQIVVTYTVQELDTVSDIGTLLSAKIKNIEDMNKNTTENPSFIVVGWVLFVPVEKNGFRTSRPGFRHKRSILIAILLAVTLLSVSTLIFILYLRRKREQNVEVPDKAVSKSLALHLSFSLHNQLPHKENMEDGAVFESDGPVIFSLEEIEEIEEIEEATGYFNETKKIGEGGCYTHP
ncbi:hypothetical protein ACFX13_011809 [Malus domestica]